MTTDEIELVEKARGGDRPALEALIRSMKDLVYNLSIRMLNSRADAEDMTQEILLKLVTNLGAFRGDSSFRTWTYRVASNHLLTARKRAAETAAESFEAMATRLEAGLASGEPALDDAVVISEAKQICTSSMLSCLDRDHRLAFILGEILELPSEEACAVLEIEDSAFRKRVSRARARMEEFMSTTCGVVNEANPCRCAKQAAKAVKIGYLDPTCLVWSSHPARPALVKARIADIDGLSRAVAVFRGHPDYVGSDAIISGLQQALGARTSDLLD